MHDAQYGTLVSDKDSLFLAHRASQSCLFTIRALFNIIRALFNVISQMFTSKHTNSLHEYATRHFFIEIEKFGPLQNLLSKADDFTWTRRASWLLAETSTYFTVFLANPVQKAQIYGLRETPQLRFTLTAKI